MKKIKILYIVPSLRLCNGISSYAMNYLRNIDNEKIQIDFFSLTDKEEAYVKEIESDGGKVYFGEKIKIKNIIKNVKRVKKFMMEHAKEYDIIHCHVLNSGAFFMYYAKKYGIKNRIIHSHVTKTSDKFFSKLIDDIILPLTVFNSNYFCACSKDAGDTLLKGKNVKVIKNAISGERFKFNERDRKRIRKELNVENKFVIGNIGRFCNQKNQEFLISLIEDLKTDIPNVVALIIGRGPLEEKLKKQVKELKLDENVIFLPQCENINELYQAMDVFILPSKYEGLGIVLIEAQVSGLHCISSTNVPQEAKITDNYDFIDLKDNKKVWIQ